MEEGGEPQLGQKKVNWFTWAMRATEMRNMHWREAMKAWTSDSAAKHIAILKERCNQEKELMSFKGHWDHVSSGNSHVGTYQDSE